MADTSLVFNILAKDKASKTLDSIKNKIAGFGKAGLLAGVAGLGIALKTGFGEVSDYQAGLSQLQAGLKSTGGVSGTTAKGLEDLASQIQSYSGQTDDSIVKSEGLLLTFTNIHNAAGKNNDIFTQATKITADMAQRFGTDAASQAIVLGKALNDPVKGITALTRVGVSFTDAQKKQIAAMVKSGDTIGAQKVILGELNTEFGGSAKAFGQTMPGQIQRARRAFEDFSQNLVSKLLPVATKLIGFIERNAGALKILAVALAAIAGPIYLIVKAQKAWTEAQRIFNIVQKANPMILIISLLVALGVALVVAYKKSETFRNIVNGAFNAVVAVGKTLAHFFTDTIPAAFNTVLDFLKKWGPLILLPFAPFIAIPLLVVQHWNDIVKFFTGIPGRVGSALATFASVIWSPIADAMGRIRNLVDQIIGFFRDLPGKIVSFFTHLADDIINLVGRLPGMMLQLGKNAGNQFLSGLKGSAGGFFGFLTGPYGTGPAGSLIKKAVGATGGIVTRPTMALIGEAGPEAVIPLNRTPGSSPLPTGGAGGGQEHFHFYLGGKQVAEVTLTELRQMKGRGVNLGLA